MAHIYVGCGLETGVCAVVCLGKKFILAVIYLKMWRNSLACDA